MNYLYNNKKSKEKGRTLRHSQTDAERKLWQNLRRGQLGGLRFLRQYSVGNYILDFYCPKLRLAIEVDGSQHIENEYDGKRTEYLRKKNIFVLRFWNNEVLNNREGVCLKILSVIKEKISPRN